MTLTILSLALYSIATGLFVAWAAVANGLGRDDSPEGKLSDEQRRHRMRVLMVLGFASLAAALALPSILVLLSSAF